MDRRDFGKALAGAATGAGLAGASRPAQAATPAPRDAPFRVMPDLPVRRNDKIRTGGDYWIVAGSDGLTAPASLKYFQRQNVRFLSAKGPSSATPAEMAQYPHYGEFLDADGPWDFDQLKRMQDQCAAAGMVLEGVRMDSVFIVMKPGPERERYLAVIAENIRKAGKAGIKLLSYHWTMIPIRRNLSAPGRGGSTYTGFKLEPNYKDLPPTAAAGRVSLDDYWGRIDYFLKHIVPVAREAGVRLACHPYDPGGLPLGYQGVDNYDAGDFVAALKKYELMYDDVHNGFTYDTGVAGESLPDPNAQLPLLRYLSERGKIAQVHFRNIRGHQNDFLETYVDEGDVDMLNCIRVLRDTDWGGSLLPDHTPAANNPDDPHKLQSFAFAFGYIEGLLRAAREEAIRATRV